MNNVFADDDRVFHRQKFFGREFHHLSVGCRHERAVGHAVPLGEDGAHLVRECRGNVNSEGVAPFRALRADALAVMIDGLHPLGCRIGFGGQGGEIGRRGIAIAQFGTAFRFAGGIACQRVVVAAQREADRGLSLVHPRVVAADSTFFTDTDCDPLAVDDLVAACAVGLHVDPFGQIFQFGLSGGDGRCRQQQRPAQKSGESFIRVHSPANRFSHPPERRMPVCR